MDKNKVLAKNTIILGVGQFVPKIIAMITLPILTKSFSTEEYGIYDLLISLASLALPLMTLLIQQAVFRFIIEEKDKNTINKYITNSFIFVFILSFICFIIGATAAHFANVDNSLIIATFFLYFTEAIYDLLGQIARGKGENMSFSIAVIMYSVVNMLLLLLLTVFNIVNIITTLTIISISYMIAAVFLWIKLHLKNDFKIKEFSSQTIKKLLIYSVPIIPSSISLWIVNLSDRLIVTYFLGASANGIYAAASKIPNLFGTVFNVFNLAWTELAARSIKEEDINKYYSKLFNNLYSFLIGVLLLLISFSPILFNILIDDKFHEGYFQMPILFIGVLFNCFVSFFGGLYIALKKTKQVGISSLAGGLLNIIINVCLIERYGLYAASISTAVSFLIILIYRALEIKKYIKIDYNYTSIAIGVVFLILSMIIFYNNTIIAIIFNIIIAIIYNLFFNEFLKFIKKSIKQKIGKNNINNEE